MKMWTLHLLSYGVVCTEKIRIEDIAIHHAQYIGQPHVFNHHYHRNCL